MFGPVLWVVLSSFKTQAQLLEFPPSLLPYGQVSAVVAGHDEPLPLLPGRACRTAASGCWRRSRRIGIQAQLVDPANPGEPIKVNINDREPVREFERRLEQLHRAVPAVRFRPLLVEQRVHHRSSPRSSCC